MEVSAYLRFQESYFKWEEARGSQFLPAFKEFLALSGKIRFQHSEDSGHSILKIEEIERPGFATVDESIFSKDSRWLRLSAEFDVSDLSEMDMPLMQGKKQVGVHHLTKSEVQVLANEKWVDTFNDNLCWLLLSICIARFGIFRPLDCFVRFNDRNVDLEVVSSEFMESFNHIHELGWPTAKKVSLLEMWEWLHEMGCFNWKLSSSPLGRAVNALSYVLAGDNGLFPGDLFTCLMGLEALYIEGRNDLADQLSVKSQLVLGPLMNFKKIVKEMYNARSRLIHGSQNIQNRFDYCDADED